MTGKERKLLIVEDDPGLSRQMKWSLDAFSVLTASDRVEALKLMAAETPPVVTLDLGLPPDADGASEGFAALEKILAANPNTKVIVVTGLEDRQFALKAIALGAYDFCVKPIDPAVLHLIVERAFNLHLLETENRRLSQLPRSTPLPGVITASQSMLGVCGMIERVAPSNLNVLVLGESGTGKEVLARALHSLSPRAGKRFVAINCAAIPETMLEAELFGHEKGAFTGALQKVLGKIEVADRGTLFLDEIGDMPLSLQGKLLRFLQERKIERIGGRVEISVDVRVICATHRAPEDLIKDKLFREDLYYRIKEVEIDVPPLRERIGDPVLLANHFLHVVAAQNGRSLRGFTSEALGAIAAYHWPGNVRELENRIKRAVVMSQGNVLAFGDLDLPQEPVSAPTSLKAVRDVAERQALVQALAMANDNISAAAKYLGISRPTMYALMRQHGIRD